VAPVMTMLSQKVIPRFELRLASQVWCVDSGHAVWNQPVMCTIAFALFKIW
jgi:hypothetical protein